MLMNSSVEVNGGKGARGREPATGYTDTTSITSPDFSGLVETLPPIIPATELSRWLGGLYSKKTLNNMRHLKKGPRSFRLKGGRKLFSLREDVIAWLTEQALPFDPDMGV